jgi:hypothetical protein
MTLIKNLGRHSRLATNCTDEQYAELLEQMAPITEQVAEKLNL